jgi:hypothetical protein
VQVEFLEVCLSQVMAHAPLTPLPPGVQVEFLEVRLAEVMAYADIPINMRPALAELEGGRLPAEAAVVLHHGAGGGWEAGKCNPGEGEIGGWRRRRRRGGGRGEGGRGGRGKCAATAQCRMAGCCLTCMHRTRLQVLPCRPPPSA